MIKKKRIGRLIIGLVTGLIFGFLLQKGGVTRYNTIIAQLLLEDFTVLKIMLTATGTGMLGIYFLEEIEVIQLAPKSGSPVRSIMGGLIFGIGFALLGYCPGTAAGAIGQGNLDALIPGLLGLIIGSALFASSNSFLSPIINIFEFKELTLPEKFKINSWKIVIPVFFLMAIILLILELGGL